MAGRSGKVKWLINEDDTSNSQITNSMVAAPKYSVFGEKIRHVAPSSLTCSMFCGGKQCKYCYPGKFKEDEMIIKGLYSSWVTDNILAMARPSTELLKQYNIVDQFHNHSIKSIINLQLPGEHAACGWGLETSGFSYIPQDFMDRNVFFYNFGWNDYGVRSLQSILDMVKVMDFAISNGKAAVHCHAGLGRTGVLIACYIIYSERATADEAIIKMRKTRPKAIQTRGQINCVKDFAAYIKPMWVVFSEDKKRITLLHYMNRQRHLLHGEEARTLKFIPKIVFVICQRLLSCAEIDFDLKTCARITHFSFMQNSCYNTSNTPKASAPDVSHTIDILQKVHSTTDLHKSVEDVRKIDEQFKALSTPNVMFKTDNEQEYDERTLSCSRKGLLKPIKLKKSKGLRQRLEQKKLSESLNINVSNVVKRSDMDVLNSSVDSRLSQRRTSDNTSISSFSDHNELSPSEAVLKYLAFRSSDTKAHNQIERYKHKLNSSDNVWNELSEETNLPVLCGLFWSWLSQLQMPVISLKCIELMCTYIRTPEDCFHQLDREIWKLMECFITLLSKIQEKPYLVERILRRFAVIMTGDDSIPKLTSEIADMLEEDITSGVIFLKFSMTWLRLLTDSS